jgi:hypothetical protein
MKFLMLCLFFHQLLLAQPKIPTQSDLVREGIVHYFRDLPENAYAHTLELLGMGDFKLFLQMHDKNPLNSPFNMFSGHAYRRTPSYEYQFPFFNSFVSFDDLVDLEFGVCAGLTVALRKFNMLAYFDPEQKYAQAPTRDNQFYWFWYYQMAIDEIMSGSMVFIPGFANLKEFLAQPEINRYVRKVVIQQWQITNVNIMQGLRGLQGVKTPPTKERAKKNYEYLLTRLQLNYNPIVYLAKNSDSLFDKSQWIHVVQFNSISPRESDGSYTIYYWDVNDNRQKKLIINNLGQASLPGVIVIPLTWDDMEIAGMLKKNSNFCRHRPKLCYTPLVP